jgi:hypothetical protein
MFLVLLPVRNAEHDLSGYFQSVGRFADGVLALDDGSTDATRQILAQEPLVKGILHNPPREGFAGWDDAANRNRLLSAAAEFAPEWVLSLDADERIDEWDGRVLSQFTQTDAIPGLAYGFRCYPTSDDGMWRLPQPIWIYRLFHFSPGQRFPDQRFHFAPIPSQIPREAYLRTSLRIQHQGGFDQARRAARYEKYRDVDPDRRFWPSYSALLATVEDELLEPWPQRDEDEPVLWQEPVEERSVREMSRGLIAIGGGEEVEWPGVEVTVAASLRDGLNAASADLLLVLEAGQSLAWRDAEALYQALASGYGMVRCATVGKGDARVQQAQWLRANLPEEPGELGGWRPVGYRRDALDEIGELPEGIDLDLEAYLVRALARAGMLVGRVPVVLHDGATRTGELGVRAGYARGRIWAEIDLALAGPRPVPLGERLRRVAAGAVMPQAPTETVMAAGAGYLSRLARASKGEGWTIAGWRERTIALISRDAGGEPICEIANCQFAAGVFLIAGLPGSDAAWQTAPVHDLRDRLELAIGAPVDEAIRAPVPRASWSARTEFETTMRPLVARAVVLRMCGSAVEVMTPVEEATAIPALLGLRRSNALRDRLRDITWA